MTHPRSNVQVHSLQHSRSRDTPVKPYTDMSGQRKEMNEEGEGGCE
jgi:hypothetical protein